nr:MAG TPA: hypothetical protein [Caudoviricetes sp.]
MYVIVKPGNDIYHHGVKGQKWGVITKIKDYMAKRKAIKAEKDRRKTIRLEESHKKQGITKAELDHLETAEDVYRYRNNLSTNELGMALNRVKWTKEIKNLRAQEIYSRSTMAKVDKLMKNANAIAEYTNSATKVYQSIKRAKNMLDQYSKKAS